VGLTARRCALRENGRLARAEETVRLNRLFYRKGPRVRQRRKWPSKSNKTVTLFRFTETDGGLSVSLEREDYNYED
jgi:hypothetical protein